MMTQNYQEQMMTNIQTAPFYLYSENETINQSPTKPIQITQSIYYTVHQSISQQMQGLVFKETVV